jgi:hypothetical protein
MRAVGAKVNLPPVGVLLRGSLGTSVCLTMLGFSGLLWFAQTEDILMAGSLINPVTSRPW